MGAAAGFVASVCCSHCRIRVDVADEGIATGEVREFERLDRGGAMRTIAVQRDRVAVEAEVRKVTRHAGSLEQEAAELQGWGRAEERVARLELADTQRRLAAAGLERREGLLAEEEELRRVFNLGIGWCAVVAEPEPQRGELAIGRIA